MHAIDTNAGKIDFPIALNVPEAISIVPQIAYDPKIIPRRVIPNSTASLSFGRYISKS